MLQASDEPVLQFHITAQFYLENKGKYILEAWWHADPKDRKGRERDPRPFGSCFCMFFPLPLGLPYVNWASQECCLFYLRSSLRSSDLLLFYFQGLSLSYLFATAILDSFSQSNYLTILKRMYFITKGMKNYCKAPSWEFIDQIMYKTETLPATRWIGLMGENRRKRDKLQS